jgi:hypothetical protein
VHLISLKVSGSINNQYGEESTKFWKVRAFSKEDVKTINRFHIRAGCGPCVFTCASRSFWLRTGVATCRYKPKSQGKPCNMSVLLDKILRGKARMYNVPGTSSREAIRLQEHRAALSIHYVHTHGKEVPLYSSIACAWKGSMGRHTLSRVAETLSAHSHHTDTQGHKAPAPGCATAVLNNTDGMLGAHDQRDTSVCSSGKHIAGCYWRDTIGSGGGARGVVGSARLPGGMWLA